MLRRSAIEVSPKCLKRTLPHCVMHCAAFRQISAPMTVYCCKLELLTLATPCIYVLTH
jgi:hypothetical protein